MTGTILTRSTATRAALAHTMGDLHHLTVRALRRECRQIDGLIVNMALPVLIMVVFVAIFGGAVTTGSSELAYVDFVAPAVLLLAAGYGAAYTAVSVSLEMTDGMVDRLRTLPVSGWVVPASQGTASLVRNLIAVAFALVAALALGFRPSATPLEWLAALGLVSGFILAVSALAVVWGLLMKSSQAAGAFSFVVLFLPYVSDGFVPAETMPGALRGFAEHQPFTPIIETLRSLLLGMPLGGSGWLAAAWIGAGIAIGLPLAAVLFRRRTRS